MYDKLEGMNEPYIIIRVGFEAIDKLVYLIGNPDEAVNIRERAIKVALAEVNISCKKTGVRRIFTDKEIAERFCIQKWTGNKFECVCKELGVKIDEMVLY